MKTKKWITALALLLAFAALAGCTQGRESGETEPESTAEQTAAPTEAPTGEATEPAPEPEPTRTVTLASDGKNAARVTVVQNCRGDLRTSAMLLRLRLNDLTGLNYTIGMDITKLGAPVREIREIVIGHTMRTDEIQFRNRIAAKSEFAFGIQLSDQKVIITAPVDDFVPLAVDYFMEHYLKDSEGVDCELEKGSFLRITGPEERIVTGEKSDLSNIFAGHRYATRCTKVGNVPKTGNFKVLQGGCATENYAWFAMINTADYDSKAAGVWIYKLDAKTWKVVKRSDLLMLDHANDITYLPETNEIAVAHCYVDNHKVTVLDADTLKISRTMRAADRGFYSVTYNPTKKEFVCGTGKTNMLHFNSSMGFVKLCGGATTALTTQGICCDDKYIYHVLFTSSSAPDEPFNMIFVNDYATGKIRNKIRLSITDQEPENISIVNGEFILGCNSSSTSAVDIYRGELIDFGTW